MNNGSCVIDMKITSIRCMWTEYRYQLILLSISLNILNWKVTISPDAQNSSTTTNDQKTRHPSVTRKIGLVVCSDFEKMKKFFFEKICSVYILLLGILNQLYFKHDHGWTDCQNCPPKEWGNDVLVDRIIFVDKTINNQIVKCMK